MNFISNNPEEIKKEKEKKIILIKDYDKSPAVNSFLINGKRAWLDKSTRIGLVNSLQIEKSAGREITELWLDGEKYIIEIDLVLQMLVVLELYAKDCYNTTENHINNVKCENKLNKVWNYDYTKGYPQRPSFVVEGDTRVI